MDNQADGNQDATEQRGRRVWVDWHSIVANAVALALAFGILFIAWMVLRPLAILLMSIVLAETLEPIVARLQQRVRRSLAVLTTYLGVLLVLVLLVLTLVPTILTEIGGLTEELPRIQEDVTSWIDEQGWVSVDQVTGFFEGQAQGGGQLASIPLLVASGVVEVGLAIFLSIYWLIGKPGARSLMLSMVPPRNRELAEDISAEVGSTIGGYIRGVVFSGAIMAVLGFIGLTVIGVDFALPLALIFFFGELVPVLGPAIALVPALIVAAFGGVTTVILLLVLYIIMQVLESSLIYPKVMERESNIPPILVIFALLAGGSVGGIIGALVAIPLSGAIRVLILRLAVPEIQHRLGHDQPVGR